MGSDEAFAFKGPPCSCDEALALRARLVVLAGLLEAASKELNARDESLHQLRVLLHDVRELAVFPGTAMWSRIEAALSPADTQ